MLTKTDITKWAPYKVREWLVGVCSDIRWLETDRILSSKISGKELLMMSSQDLERLGVTKVDFQEQILEAIENLIFYNYDLAKETLQSRILGLAIQSRSLQRQLVAERKCTQVEDGTKNIVLSSDFKGSSMSKKQRVSLDTLSSVSNIVTSVRYITDILNSPMFAENDDYRSMKSLILALSIELTSTAQRDQFVERPNDIIERSTKALADYCDRIVQATRDHLLLEPINIETKTVWI